MSDGGDCGGDNCWSDDSVGAAFISNSERKSPKGKRGRNFDHVAIVILAGAALVCWKWDRIKPNLERFIAPATSQAVQRSAPTTVVATLQQPIGAKPYRPAADNDITRRLEEALSK